MRVQDWDQATQPLILRCCCHLAAEITVIEYVTRPTGATVQQEQYYWVSCTVAGPFGCALQPCMLAFQGLQ